MTDIFTLLAVPWIFRVEGGFVDELHDRGGETKYGISVQYLRRVDGGDINQDGVVDADDVRVLTREQAVAFYRRDYWVANGCDILPPVVALACFDAAVHHGPVMGRKLVQRALGVHDDGIFGHDTLIAIKRVDAKQFLVDYCAHRAAQFAAIIRGDPLQQRFEYGWMRRLFKLYDYCRAEA